MNNYALPKFILHLLRYEGSCIPAEGESNEQAFERCRGIAFANDPNDPGGATMMGITMPVFREWRQTFLKKPRPTVGDLQDITYDEWAYLVETVFWKMYSLHTVPYECVAITVADNIFLSGRAGIREVQRAFGCEADGIVGPKTIGALRHRVNTRERARDICQTILDNRISRLHRLPRWNIYGSGWTNRTNAIAALFAELDLTEQERKKKKENQE